MALKLHVHVLVKGIRRIKPDVYLLWFASERLSRTAVPGQFLHIKVDNKTTILRRPLSVHAIEKNIIYLLFRVRGKGTLCLSQYKEGDTLDIIGPLGKGFVITPKIATASKQLPVTNILIAGGMGVAPLVFLAQKLRYRRLSRTIALLGAKTKNDVLAEKKLRQLGCEVFVATDNGSCGFKGTVVDMLRERFIDTVHAAAHIYACGPKVMLKGLHAAVRGYEHVSCQVSFEQFMGCGIGICCGCVIETKNGYKKVCHDGPVFDSRDVW